MVSPLTIATCQFSVSPSIRRNGLMIRRQMHQAMSRGAKVVHFCETALSGYAGKEVRHWEDFDWELLREETESIMAMAGELGVWVVFGSTHPLSSGRLPHNSVYVISPKGQIVERYDKRFCTRPDLQYYTCGNHHAVVEIEGVLCGVLICYDIRFPELYREYCREGVKVIFHSFHNARAQGRGVLTNIMPATLQARAATNGMWISAANSSSPYQLWGSTMIRPDGLVAGSLRQHRAGVLMNRVDPEDWFYDASAPFRNRALAGDLCSAPAAEDDPRSLDRHSL